MRMRVQFKKTDSRAQTPRHGSRGAAGYDIGVLIDTAPEFLDDGYEMIAPMETKFFRSGLAIELPPDHFATLHARSSTLKKGLTVETSILDCDFRGEITIPVHNKSSNWVRIYDGEMLAQLVVSEYRTVIWEEVKELHDTERGEGGFGSTDGKTITI